MKKFKFLSYFYIILKKDRYLKLFNENINKLLN